MFNLTGRHLIEPNDLSLEEINGLMDLATAIHDSPKEYSEVCRGKILATLFYEPSTRTRLSFETAMLRLGGSVIGFSDANASSASKGESISDTSKIISSYADLAVMRHPVENTPKYASHYSKIPIINGGDGGNHHPTQTLTDLLTIKFYKKDINNHVVAFCGDLKFGRTVHSLISTLARFNTKKIILISPKELSLPPLLKKNLLDHYSIELQEVETLEEVISEIDILYMTRVQKERFKDESEYERLKDTYILDLDKMEDAKKDMIIMHPLPRVNEISAELDQDPRAVYFEQARLGVYARMALMMKVLGVETE